MLPIQAAKLKGMGKLGQWSNNVVNHFWFCCRTCDTSLGKLPYVQYQFLNFRVGQMGWCVASCVR